MIKRYLLSSLFIFITISFIQSQVTISGSVKRALGNQSIDVQSKVVISGDLNLSAIPVNQKYEFKDIPKGANIEIKTIESQASNPIKGLSTLDVILINNHILGKKKLINPYQLLAADLNQDKNISVGDIVLLKNMILHKTKTYPASLGDQWRYKAVTVVDPGDPTKDIIKNSVTFNDIQENKEVNFLAYKIGDLSGDAAFNNQHEVRSNEMFSLKAENQRFYKGDKVEMLVKASDISSIEGLQFTMNFDKQLLGFTGIKGEQTNISEEDFSISDRCEGYITASLLVDAGVNDDKLFTISFRAREDGELKYGVYMCSNLTASQAYNHDYETLDLNLVFEEPAPVVKLDQPVLYQNEPNPFFANTIVNIDMPDTQDGSFSIFNADGKLIKLIESTYTKGSNTVNLQLDDFPASGIYYYQLKTKDFVGVKKMVVCK